MPFATEHWFDLLDTPQKVLKRFSVALIGALLMLSSSP
jgi:hypothetical protein